MKQPNLKTQTRGTKAVKAAGKKLSVQVTESSLRIVTKDEKNDQDHEKVVLLDNDTGKHIISLYRNTERAVSMSHLWGSFISETQLLRDQIGHETLGSFLTEEESNAIKLKHNAHIFPELINNKGYLRSKDNLAAANKVSRVGGVFTKSIANVEKHTEFKARAKALRAKVNAFEKQANAYDTATKLVEKKPDTTIDEINLESLGMIYLRKEIPLSRKELNTHLQAHENHLICVAEKLRGEMSAVAAYVNRAKKRLRDDIQLKVATDLKLLRNIKNNEQFELKSWQIAALPSNAHECQCFHCATSLKDAFQSATYKFENTLPEVSPDGNDITALSTRSTKRLKLSTSTSSPLKTVVSASDKDEDIVRSDNDTFIPINKASTTVTIAQDSTVGKNGERVVEPNAKKSTANNEVFDPMKNKQVIATIARESGVDKDGSRVVQPNAQESPASNEVSDSMKDKQVTATIAQESGVGKDGDHVVRLSGQEFAADSEGDDAMKKNKTIASTEPDFGHLKSASGNIVLKISDERLYRFDGSLIDDVLRRRPHSG